MSLAAWVTSLLLKVHPKLSGNVVSPHFLFLLYEIRASTFCRRKEQCIVQTINASDTRSCIGVSKSELFTNLFTNRSQKFVEQKWKKVLRIQASGTSGVQLCFLNPQDFSDPPEAHHGFANGTYSSGCAGGILVENSGNDDHSKTSPPHTQYVLVGWQPMGSCRRGREGRKEE